MDMRILVKDLRDNLKSSRKILAALYRKTQDADAYLKQHCLYVDNVLIQLWNVLQFPPQVVLVAVGGFGRGELYPASDIDLLILLPEEPDDSLTQKLEQLIGLLWDVGLEVGHSVRTIAHCLEAAEQDITVQTALLENRLLTGNTELYSLFVLSMERQLKPDRFFMAKCMEQEARHHRYQEAAYSLEPNCKESPGGHRDLQNILWVARASGYGTHWSDLKSKKLITQDEQVQIQACENYLQGLRIQLHLLTGRREDRLLFDHQSALALALGIHASATKRASEELMQAYYRNAKQVIQLNAILLQSIGFHLFPSERTAPHLLNARFQSSGGFLDITHDKVFEETPSAILESFSLLQEHPDLRGMTAKTLRALWRNRKLIDPSFRENPRHRELFLSLFQGKQGVIREFERMNQYDILGRYLPAFGRIVGQMQHDLFHVYTVDQHILMVMRNLRRFAREEFAHEYPFCSELINAFHKPWVLYIAALFHDIAKGRGGDHSILGMHDAQEFCEDHGLDIDDEELVVWLVKHHLHMSQVAQKEDVSDPNVIAAFSDLVKDERHLTALYLLTVADIRGTSPKVWNSWKASLLENLYRLTLESLKAGVSPEPQGVIQERQAEALSLLRFFALSDTVHERLWKQLDTVYFLRHTAEEIAWHTRALHYCIGIDTPVVKARLQPGKDLQVMVYTKDQPDLFLKLVAFFARAGYSIVDAKIHTTRHGYALDSFVLLDVANNANDREMIAVIEHELCRTLEQGLPAEAPAPGRPSRQAKHFPLTPEVHIQPNEHQPAQYVLSIIATDRPGLLFHIARILALHNVQLVTARISTLGERVEDTFLIAGPTLELTANRVKLENDLLSELRV